MREKQKVTMTVKNRITRRLNAILVQRRDFMSDKTAAHFRGLVMGLVDPAPEDRMTVAAVLLHPVRNKAAD